MNTRSSLLNLLVLFATLRVLAQSTDAIQPARKWVAEVNVLWPIFPGNLYNAKVLREVYRGAKTSGQVFVGVNYHPEAFREEEGNWSALEATFGYRQFIWKGLHGDLYNAVGQGRIKNSVVDGRNYSSLDYITGVFLATRHRSERRASAPTSTFSRWVCCMLPTKVILTRL